MKRGAKHQHLSVNPVLSSYIVLTCLTFEISDFRLHLAQRSWNMTEEIESDWKRWFALNIPRLSWAEGSWTVHATPKYSTLSILDSIKYQFQLLKFCQRPLKCLLQWGAEALCGFEVWITSAGRCVHSASLSPSGMTPKLCPTIFEMQTNFL